jgi:hypothetical protein
MEYRKEALAVQCRVVELYRELATIDPEVVRLGSG